MKKNSQTLTLEKIFRRSSSIMVGPNPLPLMARSLKKKKNAASLTCI